MKRLIGVIICTCFFLLCKAQDVDSLIVELKHYAEMGQHEIAINKGIEQLHDWENYLNDSSIIINNRVDLIKSLYDKDRLCNLIGWLTGCLCNCAGSEDFEIKVSELKQASLSSIFSSLRLMSSVDDDGLNVEDVKDFITDSIRYSVIDAGFDLALCCHYLVRSDYYRVIEFGSRALNGLKEINSNSFLLGSDGSLPTFYELHVPLYQLLSTAYGGLGYYGSAVDLLIKALDICNKRKSEYSPKVFYSLMTQLATAYYSLGEYYNSLSYANEASKLLNDNSCSVNPQIQISNLAISSCCFCKMGLPLNAKEKLREALAIYEKEVTKNKSINYEILSSLALACSMNEMFDEEKMLNEALNEELKKVPQSDMVSINISRARLLHDNKKYNEAIDLLSQSLRFLKSHQEGQLYIYGVDGVKASGIDVARIDSCLVKDGEPITNYHSEIESETWVESDSVFTEGSYPNVQVQLLQQLADNYYHLRHYHRAEECSEEAMDMLKSIKKTHTHEFADVLCDVARWKSCLGDFFGASKICAEALDTEQFFLSSQLSTLTSEGRQRIWNLYSNRFLEKFPYYVYYTFSNEYAGELYNKSCLFAKGLLLSTEMELRKLIEDSPNDEAKSKFEDLQKIRSNITKYYQTPEFYTHVNIDSLEHVATNLESELMYLVKDFGDVMRSMKVTWHDVQEKLTDKDLAVEFLSFPVTYEGKKHIKYIALVLGKGYDSPIMGRIFDDKELEAIKDSYYSGNELSKLVWGGLAFHLEGIENIYFTPSGELYNIAIESVPHWEQDCMMSDRFNLYRLSSTRELAIARDETPSSGAVIYGGIKYDSDVASMGMPKSDAEPLYAVRGFEADSTAYRGTKWEPLPGTLAEANAIYSILGSSKASIKTGVLATETSFKDLSGKKKQMLHIATHGFYWSEPLADYKRKAEQLGFLQTGEERQGYVEDKAMTRTGLLFAGAQNTFNKVEIPAGVDDGVLTAQEIAQLDLRGLDLVVLSACQTGLGEINGDGVFGLQRGFKKAGARSIMMSLWSVNDDATKDLMTQFYTSLSVGKSKREAFNAAQQYIKDHDKDYKYADNEERDKELRAARPHWAAFILLDATDKNE